MDSDSKVIATICGLLLIFGISIVSGVTYYNTHVTPQQICAGQPINIQNDFCKNLKDH